MKNLKTEKGWSLIFPYYVGGAKVLLDDYDREGKLATMQLLEGDPFEREDVLNTEDRDITIYMVAEEGIIGGMTYRLDPDLEIYDETGGEE